MLPTCDARDIQRFRMYESRRLSNGLRNPVPARSSLRLELETSQSRGYSYAEVGQYSVSASYRRHVGQMLRARDAERLSESILRNYHQHVLPVPVWSL